MRKVIKSFEEFAEDLKRIATPEDYQKYMEYLEEKQRVYMIRMIKKYDLY